MLKVVSAMLSLGFWTASCILWYHYAFTRPSKPDIAAGRTYAQHQIGEVFYLTSHEHFVWYFLVVSGVLCFLLTAAFYQIGRRLN